MNAPVVTLGVSLKMYFGYQQTLQWCQSIAALLEQEPSVRNGQVQVFVIPSFPMLAPALEIFEGLALVGAQNLFWEDKGAYTGEVSPEVLKEMGCNVVEIGHAERRRYFAESDRQIADKTAAAWRNGLIPVLCIGEDRQCLPAEAARLCAQQLTAALDRAQGAGLSGDLVVAYEPQWAIGAVQPASPQYIGAVCTALRQHCIDTDLQNTRVIYGGSAGPGLLTQLGDHVDGLFLGRFAHEPEAFAAILGEARSLAQSRLASIEEGVQWQSA